MSVKAKKKIGNMGKKTRTTRSMTGSLPPPTPPCSPAHTYYPEVRGGSSRHRKPPPCPWAYTVIDPATLPVPAKPWTVKNKVPHRPKALGFLSTKRLKKRTVYSTCRWARDDVQLAHIYVNQRSRRNQGQSVDLDVVSPSRGSTSSKKRRSHQSDLVTIAQTLEDVVESVIKQPTVQKVTSRIRRIPIKGRGVPKNLVDPDDLAEELKLRLAATTPIIDSRADPKTGKYSFRQRPHATRVVTLFSIDEEGDPHEKQKFKVRLTRHGGQTFTAEHAMCRCSPISGSQGNPGSPRPRTSSPILASRSRSKQVGSSHSRKPQSASPRPSTSGATPTSVGSRAKSRTANKKRQ